MFAGADVGTVASGPDGVLALGRDRATGRVITWTTPDGRTWARHDLPADVFGGGVPDQAARGGPGWLASGYRASWTGLHRELWTSPDGGTWSLDPDPTGRADLRNITSLGEILVADEVDGDASTIVRSTDGLAWRPVNAAESGLTILGSGLRRLFATDQTRLWASTDGFDWRKVPGYPPLLASPGAAITECGRMVETADGLETICEGSDDVGSFPVAVASSDGDTWSATTPWGMATNLVPSIATVLAIGGGAVIQFPPLTNEGDVADLAPTFETDVSGVLSGWTKTDEPPVPLARGVTAGDHVVAVGVANGSPDAQVWIGTLAGAGPMLEETAGPSRPNAPVSGEAPPETQIVSPSGSWSLTRVDGSTTFGSVADRIDLVGMAAAPGGRFLVLGRASDEIVPWTSPDGSHWTRGIPFAKTPPAGSTAGGPPALVAAAPGGRSRFVVFAAGDAPAWLSEDGLRWRPVRDRALAGMQVRDVVATDEGLLAVGAAFDDGGNSAVALSSGDGVRWTRATIEPGAAASTVVRVPAGFVVGGVIHEYDENQLAIAWTSPDGRAWSRAPADASHQSQEPFTSLSQFGSPASVLGFSSFGAWSSADGRTWQSVPGAPSGATDAFALGDRVVAVGPGQDVAISDDGRTWHPVEHAMSTAFRAGVSNGKRAVLLAEPRIDAATGIRHNDVWVLAPPLEPVASTVCPPEAPTAAQYIELAPVDRLACYGTRRITFKAWLTGAEGGPSLAVSRRGQPLLVLAYPSALEVSLQAVYAAPRSATSLCNPAGRAPSSPPPMTAQDRYSRTSRLSRPTSTAASSRGSSTCGEGGRASRNSTPCRSRRRRGVSCPMSRP